MSHQKNRLSLLRRIQDAHKDDIKTYVSGHLNQSKLQQLEKMNHEVTWPSSKEPPLRLKPASHPVHLPVRKGQLTQKCQKQKSMQDTVTEFSFGALGRYCSYSSTEIESNSVPFESTGLKGSLTCDTREIKKENRMDIEKCSLIEELKLPEIMFYAKDKHGRNCPTKTKTDQAAVSLKRHFIKSHLGHVTKEDQYEAMKNFEQTVMNVQDGSDKGLLTGERIVRKLKERLNKKLKSLEDSSKRGPNFHRLQAYSDSFSKIIEQSTTFSRLLKMIKDEYDSYLAYILDQNRVSRHQALYSQMPSLSKAKSVTEAIRHHQNELKNLEDEVSKLLTENERLREDATRERQNPVSTTSEGVSDIVFKTRVHVEEVPKDFQEQVEDFHSQIAEQLETLENMRKYQRENCVPSSVCQHFEQCIKETEVDIQKLLKQNEFLEQSIEELEHELEMILSQYGVSEKDARTLWKKVNITNVLEYGRSENQ